MAPSIISSSKSKVVLKSENESELRFKRFERDNRAQFHRRGSPWLWGVWHNVARTYPFFTRYALKRVMHRETYETMG